MKTRPLKLKGDAVKNNNKDIVHRDEIYINVLWQEELKILEEINLKPTFYNYTV